MELYNYSCVRKAKHKVFEMSTLRSFPIVLE